VSLLSVHRQCLLFSDAPTRYVSYYFEVGKTYPLNYKVSNIYRYTVGTQLCYIIRCYTTYQLHVSATLLGHHQVCI